MFSFLLTFLVTFFLATSSAKPRVKRGRMVGKVAAHVSHGPNQFNGMRIADYSGLFNEQIFHEDGVYEIAACTDGVEEELITSSTDMNTLVCTTTNFYDFVGIPLSDPSKKNIPISDVGTLELRSGSINFTPNPFLPFLPTRVLEKKFTDDIRRGDVFSTELKQGMITVGDWNMASGMISVRYLKDSGLYEIELEMCGFRNSMYTVHEVTVRNAATANETTQTTPAGGISSVVITNKHGYGYHCWTQHWNPLEACMTDGDCTIGYGVVYQWDSIAYGGTPSLPLVGMTGGIVLAHHLWVPTIGEVVMSPHNMFVGSTCMF